MWLLFSCSIVSDSLQPRGLQHARLLCPSLSLLRLTPIESVMPSHRLILYHPLSSCPQSFPASGSFLMKSVLHIRWPKYWSFSFSIHPSNEYSGLISLRIDWFDLLAVQGTLKSLLQNHSLKASILQHSAFFMVQLSYLVHNYRKNHSLTRRTFVGKLGSLLFNTLSRLIKTFLPKSKHL